MIFFPIIINEETNINNPEETPTKILFNVAPIPTIPITKSKRKQSLSQTNEKNCDSKSKETKKRKKDKEDKEMCIECNEIYYLSQDTCDWISCIGCSKNCRYCLRNTMQYPIHVARQKLK